MITSLDNLANPAVPNSSISSSSWQGTLNALPNPKAPHPSGTPQGIVTPTVTELPSGITAKLADLKSPVTKTRPLDKTQWEVVKKTNHVNQKDDAAGTSRESKDYKIINSVYFTPGCANPPNLNTTVLLDIAANISLLTPNAP
ncbi:LOW QUALITY PROTEIN: hypothetical protein ACHAW6_001855 [Cyclotella cf. meneghiniana]